MCNNPVLVAETDKQLYKSRFSSPAVALLFKNLKRPCGGCLGCRIDNLVLWSARCNYEYYKYSSAFVTLTYNKYFVPKNETGNEYSLRRSDFEKFIDNLRHKLIDYPVFKNCNNKFHYFGCGEYGDFKNRSHMHVLFFGLDFQKHKKLFDTSWPYGYVKTLPILNGGVRYVVDYFTKSHITGDLAVKMYDDKGIERPFISCSRGLGSQLFYDHSEEIRNGLPLKIGSRLIPVPMYYKNLFSHFSDDEILSRLRQQKLFKDDLKSDSIKAGYSSVDDYLIDITRANEKTLESKLRNKGVPVISSYKGYKTFETSLLASEALA